MNIISFKTEALFSTAYFAPILYYSKMVQNFNIFVEIHENFLKQSYRNRCQILAANGILNLSVPIQKGVQIKTLTKDIKIDYSENWQNIHFKSIESAYKSSPFYDYCIYDFMIFFKKKYTFLIDLNLDIHNVLSEYLENKILIKFTEDFINLNNNDFEDYRYSINPKFDLKKITNFETPKYKQVFSDKFEFVPNLSILDLLFNLGNQTTWYLKNCNK